ncbi:nuclear receptor subfamily 2 group E member 1 isoform X2 [Cephus cinctus]|uniref:Nuclear receptor subfamily 2 group E member 1 isoform X2 n=1 Tax=Cephus cinctus TaxID=211228 RepID=A0AAJ7BN48_CEPCN|nr:nuclear receptor subfamily 2 group E member 1 isoform X2 [Cephus cinctus]
MGTGDRLLDIPCNVCGDRSSGKHYGIYSCDGCSGFFKRSIHSNREYTCKAQGAMKGRCPIDKTHRNQCRACRLTKCFKASMNRDAVQHERGPRKPKPLSVLTDKRHQQQSPNGVTRLSPHPGTPGHHDTSRVEFRAHILAHQRRLRCERRPYSRPVALMQKPFETTPSSASLVPPPPPPPPSPQTTALNHSAAVTLRPQPPLLQILMTPEKYQEIMWSARLRSESEVSLDQTETETSHSPTASLQSLSPTWEILQETTARLLFMAVRWVRWLAPFRTLAEPDQLLLLERAWTPLFLLHLAQWSVSWDISGILESKHVRGKLPYDNDESHGDLTKILHIMRKFRQIGLDTNECGCLKAVALFASDTRDLNEVETVDKLQDQAQCILSDYIRSRYQDPHRCGRLLMLLWSLRTVKPSTVEFLFFRETIGEIPIARLLRDMYMEGHQETNENKELRSNAASEKKTEPKNGEIQSAIWIPQH